MNKIPLLVLFLLLTAGGLYYMAYEAKSIVWPWLYVPIAYVPLHVVLKPFVLMFIFINIALWVRK